MIPQNRSDPLRQRNQMRLVQNRRNQKLFQIPLLPLPLLHLLLIPALASRTRTRSHRRLILDPNRVPQKPRHGVVAIDDDLLRKVRKPTRIRRKMHRSLQRAQFGQQRLHQELRKWRTRYQRGRERILRSGYENDLAGANDGWEGG